MSAMVKYSALFKLLFVGMPLALPPKCTEVVYSAHEQ